MVAWGVVLAAAAGGPARADDPPATETVPRVVKATAATAEPLVIERRRPLFDPAAAERMELVVVLSHPRPTRVAGGEEGEGGAARGAAGGAGDGEGGMLGGVRPTPQPVVNAVSRWFDARQAELLAIGRDKAVEIMGAGVGQPAVRVLRNDPVRGVDHREPLRAEGYTGRARRRSVVDGQRVWAALYSRQSRPASARLGEVTERVTVRFEPTIDRDGVVRLNAAATPEVAPAEPPAGVDEQTWTAAVNQRWRWLKAEADRMLAFRLNLRRVRAPQEAAFAFERGQPHPLRLTVPYWGSGRAFTVVLEGEAEPRVGGAMGEAAARDDAPPTPAAAVFAAAAGLWEVKAEHPTAESIGGFAELTAGGGFTIEFDHPDGTQTHAGVPLGLKVRAGGIVGSLYGGAFPAGGSRFRLELHPSGRAMRGHSLDGEGEPTGRLLFRRLEPTVEKVTVVPAGNGALDFQAMVNRTVIMNADKPYAYVEVQGKNLPRYFGADPESYYSNFAGHDDLRLSDPTITYHKEAAKADGTGVRVWFWLNFTPDRFTRPGRKTLWIGETAVEFDLAYENYELPAAHVEALMFINVAGGDSFDPTLIRTDDELVLAAQFDRPPGDDVVRPTLTVERDGQTVYTFPPGTAVLRRSDTAGDSYVSAPFTLLRAAGGEAHGGGGDDAGAAPATPPATQPHGFRFGDVVVAELDGTKTKIAISSSTRARLIRPKIRFLADPRGERQLGRTYAGATRIDLLPVGQRFWIEADYLTQQREPRKTITLRWQGGSREVELFRVSTHENLYRAGPFLIDPPATQPARSDD